MTASDALIVGEDWISEHYFTTDATKQSSRRGCSSGASNGRPTRPLAPSAPASPSRAAASSTSSSDWPRATTAPARCAPLYDQLLDVLGYRTLGLTTERPDEHAPVIRVSRAGLTGHSPLAILEADAVESVDELLAKDAPTLVTPYQVDEKTGLTSVARALSTIFVSDGPPDVALVLAGQFMLVAERERWAESRYLAIDLQLAP